MGNKYILADFDKFDDIKCTLFRFAFVDIARWLMMSWFSWKLRLVEDAAEKIDAY